MKFKNSAFESSKEILVNDHYVAVPYDCTDLDALAKDGVIPAGTIIPANDKTAKGVLLSAVNLNENPNGTIVIHGFIKKSKLPVVPTEDTVSENSTTIGAVSALKQITFI